MPGQHVKVGPFVGGLNTYSDPTLLADEELVECVNLELDLDGSLVSRPGIFTLDGPSASVRVHIIGTGLISGAWYLFGSNSGGIYYYAGGVWTTITTTVEASVAIQYAGNIYFIPRPVAPHIGNGGRWSPSGGWVAMSTLPAGQGAAVYKERIYITPGFEATTNETRLRFCEPGDANTWPAANFIDVGQGDGEKLADLIVYQDNIMLFKDHSTFIFAYDARPTEGVLRKTNNTIGVENQHCVVAYQNSIFVLHKGSVYEMGNLDYNKISRKVPFELDQSAPSGWGPETVHMSVLGDRLICRYWKKIYVFNLLTRTWSTWEATLDHGPSLHYFGPIKAIHPATGSEYYAGSSLGTVQYLQRLYDKTGVSTTETTIDDWDHDIICYIKTKNFDMEVSHLFKRLWWWGVDFSSSRVMVGDNIEGQATPVNMSFNVTWEQLHTRTWDSILGTWDNPLTEPGIISTIYTSQTGVARRFARFLKGLRFRQINFKVIVKTNGTTAEGPCRLFGLTLVVEPKQGVPKQVN